MAMNIAVDTPCFTGVDTPCGIIHPDSNDDLIIINSVIDVPIRQLTNGHVIIINSRCTQITIKTNLLQLVMINSKCTYGIKLDISYNIKELVLSNSTSNIELINGDFPAEYNIDSLIINHESISHVSNVHVKHANVSSDATVDLDYGCVIDELEYNGTTTRYAPLSERTVIYDEEDDDEEYVDVVCQMVCASI